jgi:hypothetical protein
MYFSIPPLVYTMNESDFNLCLKKTPFHAILTSPTNKSTESFDVNSLYRNLCALRDFIVSLGIKKPQYMYRTCTVVNSTIYFFDKNCATASWCASLPQRIEHCRDSSIIRSRIKSAVHFRMAIVLYARWTDG